MENRAIKINSLRNSQLALKIIPGHFATSYSHVNYYIDMTTIKSRLSEATEAAKSMALLNDNNLIIDTIVCMDGCEVIGGYLAQELSKAGFLSMNTHKTIYIISPEFSTNGQMIFRDSNQHAIFGKNILLLVASVTTGNTVRKSLDCIQYYGGKIQAINSIFSATDKINGIPVSTIFKAEDIPEYKNYNINDCPFCQKNMRIEALINGYGYSKL